MPPEKKIIDRRRLPVSRARTRREGGERAELFEEDRLVLLNGVLQALRPPIRLVAKRLPDLVDVEVYAPRPVEEVHVLPGFPVRVPLPEVDRELDRLSFVDHPEEVGKLPIARVEQRHVARL